MKYISQLNGFWNWVRTNEISHLEVDLYLSILDIANTSSWKTQFTIPNSTLGRFDKNALTRARNKLVQYGLIKYNKGKKGQAPTYSIVKLYDTEISPIVDTYNDTNNDTNTAIYPYNDTYIDTDNDTNSDTNMQPIQGIYIDKDKDKSRNITPIIPFDGKLKEKVSEWLAYKRERREQYKETGQKALFAKIQNQAAKYGENAVISAIDTAMANNWKGFFPESENKDLSVFGEDYNHEDLEELTRRRNNNA